MTRMIAARKGVRGGNCLDNSSEPRSRSNPEPNGSNVWLGLKVKVLIWTYINSWLAENCTSSTVLFIVFKCTIKSHDLFGEAECPFNYVWKTSLKPQCVNKLSEFTFSPIPIRKWNHCKCKSRILYILLVFNHAQRNFQSATKPHSAD